jgi:hypothetical protein
MRVHSVSERVTTAFLMYSSGSAQRVSIHFVHTSFIVMVNVDVLSSFFVYVVVHSIADIYNDKRKLSDHKSAKSSSISGVYGKICRHIHIIIHCEIHYGCNTTHCTVNICQGPRPVWLGMYPKKLYQYPTYSTKERSIL